ncbi:IucA/IucC family protein [Umezawaea sp. Da 62-37]|uniref:IucA/IucC family protein n=1 Tax=Umezawaea sp. Da 62-37 TaxID=3075927 RepID=UPI0028F6EF11|nr:IucA/IucC family protein [Umezawaea sp. Da 62-37]WNV86614.1 IucA/IucC family protein [Umezawaea sp. Da 62-37]
MSRVPMRWSTASTALLAKLIGELAFESLLAPESDGDGYRLDLPAARYTFTAARGAFGGWTPDPGTLRRVPVGPHGYGADRPADDVQLFLVEVGPVLGVPPTTLANYLVEITATLAADVALAASARPVAELAKLDHGELEGHLTGHPRLVANKGRIGFSAADVAAYAPESRRPLRLPWLAVHRGLGEFRAIPSLSEHGLRDAELGAEAVAGFTAVLRGRDLDPDAFVWMPVHPWQLDNVVRAMWAPEVAADRIVVLGEAPDEYLPTQSIRTLSNVDRADRCQVKLPLRILNTTVWRGVLPEIALAAPVVTQWLKGVWAADERLTGWGTELLGEIASVAVEHPRMAAIDGSPYRLRETLACVWREPVEPRLAAGERVWPLAAVLHVDSSGHPLVAELVSRSGVGAGAWVSALLKALLRPLLHLLFHYGITVNPHGQNVMVVEGPDGLPARIAVKDLIDDVSLSLAPVPERGPEPDEHDPVLPRRTWPALRSYLVNAFLVGVGQPLDLLLPDARLWDRARGEVEAYRRRFPAHAARIDAADLLGASFPHYPLNGDRLLVTGYAEQADHRSVRPKGEIPNPLATATPIAPPDGW